jgi:hypothetical protein
MKIRNIIVDSLQVSDGRWQPYGFVELQDGEVVIDSRMLIENRLDTKQEADNYFKSLVQLKYSQFSDSNKEK